MKAFFNELTSGMGMSNEDIIKRWEKLGFTQGIEDKELKLNVAKSFDSFARYLMSNDKYDHWGAIAFPLVRRIMTGKKVNSDDKTKTFAASIEPEDFFGLVSTATLKNLFDWATTIRGRFDGSHALNYIHAACKLAGADMEKRTIDGFIQWFHSGESKAVLNTISDLLIAKVDAEAEITCIIGDYVGDRLILLDRIKQTNLIQRDNRDKVIDYWRKIYNFPHASNTDLDLKLANTFDNFMKAGEEVQVFGDKLYELLALIVYGQHPKKRHTWGGAINGLERELEAGAFLNIVNSYSVNDMFDLVRKTMKGYCWSDNSDYVCFDRLLVACGYDSAMITGLTLADFWQKFMREYDAIEKFYKDHSVLPADLIDDMMNCIAWFVAKRVGLNSQKQHMLNVYSL